MSHQFLPAYQYSKMHPIAETYPILHESQLFLPFQSEKRNNFQKKPLSIMPLLLCKAIHNIKQNIVPQMNFSSNILLFLFHIFDPEIIRFRYSEPKNSKSYSRSILLRTKRRKKKNTRPINRIQSSKNPSRDFAKERRKKITDRAAAAAAEVAARVDTRIAHTGE